MNEVELIDSTDSSARNQIVTPTMDHTPTLLTPRFRLHTRVLMMEEGKAVNIGEVSSIIPCNEGGYHQYKVEKVASAPLEGKPYQIVSQEEVQNWVIAYFELKSLLVATEICGALFLGIVLVNDKGGRTVLYSDGTVLASMKDADYEIDVDKYVSHKTHLPANELVRLMEAYKNWKEGENSSLADNENDDEDDEESVYNGGEDDDEESTTSSDDDEESDEDKSESRRSCDTIQHERERVAENVVLNSVSSLVDDENVDEDDEESVYNGGEDEGGEVGADSDSSVDDINEAFCNAFSTSPTINTTPDCQDSNCKKHSLPPRSSSTRAFFEDVKLLDVAMAKVDVDIDSIYVTARSASSMLKTLAPNATASFKETLSTKPMLSSRLMIKCHQGRHQGGASSRNDDNDKNYTNLYRYPSLELFTVTAANVQFYVHVSLLRNPFTLKKGDGNRMSNPFRVLITIALNFSRDFATGIIDEDAKEAFADDENVSSLITKLEELRELDCFQWLKSIVKFSLSDSSRSLKCNVADLQVFMSIFEVTLELFGNVSLQEERTEKFFKANSHFLTAQDNREKSHVLQTLIGSGNFAMHSKVLFENQMFSMSVAGLKLHTHSCKELTANSLKEAIKPSLDKINEIVQVEKYMEEVKNNTTWFCDLGMVFIPKDRNTILAPKATLAALNRRFRYPSYILSGQEEGNSGNDDGLLNDLNPTEVDRLYDRRSNNLNAAPPQPVTPTPSQISLEEDAEAVDEMPTPQELDIFASGNCVKNGAGREYDVFLHPNTSSKHMGHVELDYYRDDNFHTQKLGSCLMSSQSYITESRDIEGYNVKGIDILRSIPGLLRSLLQNSMPEESYSLECLKKCLSVLKTINFSEYKREIKNRESLALRIEGMWYLEPGSGDPSTDAEQGGCWSNRNFNLDFDAVLQTTICHAEKEKTITEFLDTLEISSSIVKQVLLHPQRHTVSPQLKALSVYAAELLSYLPGSAKGGFQLPGTLMKSMRMIHKRHEPLHIPGTLGTDDINPVVSPVLPEIEQNLVNNVSYGLNPQMLCLSGSVSKQIYSLILSGQPSDSHKKRLEGILSETSSPGDRTKDPSWIVNMKNLLNDSKNGTGFGSKYFPNYTRAGNERNLLALMSLVDNIISAALVIRNDGGESDGKAIQLFSEDTGAPLNEEDISMVLLPLARVIVYGNFFQSGIDIRRKKKTGFDVNDLVVDGLAPYCTNTHVEKSFEIGADIKDGEVLLNMLFGPMRDSCTPPHQCKTKSGWNVIPTQLYYKVLHSIGGSKFQRKLDHALKQVFKNRNKELGLQPIVYHTTAARRLNGPKPKYHRVILEEDLSYATRQAPQIFIEEYKKAPLKNIPAIVLMNACPHFYQWWKKSLVPTYPVRFSGSVTIVFAIIHYIAPTFDWCQETAKSGFYKTFLKLLFGAIEGIVPVNNLYQCNVFGACSIEDLAERLTKVAASGITKLCDSSATDRDGKKTKVENSFLSIRTTLKVYKKENDECWKERLGDNWFGNITFSSKMGSKNDISNPESWSLEKVQIILQLCKREIEVGNRSKSIKGESQQQKLRKTFFEEELEEVWSRGQDVTGRENTMGQDSPISKKRQIHVISPGVVGESSSDQINDKDDTTPRNHRGSAIEYLDESDETITITDQYFPYPLNNNVTSKELDEITSDLTEAGSYVVCSPNESSNRSVSLSSTDHRRSHHLRSSPISVKDLSALEKGKILSDQIIMFWFAWINRKRTEEEKATAYCFDPSFLTDLYYNKGTTPNFARTVKKKDIVFLPLCYHSHWTLFVLVRNNQNPYVMHMCSKGNPPLPQFQAVIQKWYSDTWEVNAKNADIPFIQQKNVNKQSNGIDCALFVCRFMYDILANANNMTATPLSDCANIVSKFYSRNLETRVTKFRSELITLFKRLKVLHACSAPPDTLVITPFPPKGSYYTPQMQSTCADTAGLEEYPKDLQNFVEKFQVLVGKKRKRANENKPT